MFDPLLMLQFVKQKRTNDMKVYPTPESLGLEPRTDTKDCAFQYYSDGNLVEDTNLITRTEANALWEKHKPSFRMDVERGVDASVALWINMKYLSDYQETAVRHDAADCIMHKGLACTVDPI